MSELYAGEINESCKVVIAHRYPEPGVLAVYYENQGRYGLPGGHPHLGETSLNCAMREVREETGVDLSGIPLTPHASFLSGQKTIRPFSCIVDPGIVNDIGVETIDPEQDYRQTP